jgi:DNA-binding response OmpR family regulator
MPFIAKKISAGAHTSHPAEQTAGDLGARAPEKVVTVLAISPVADDHTFLRNIFSHSNWQLDNARTWQEALVRLGRHRTPVVICETELPDASWQDVLSGLSQMTEPPVLVVSSRLADERLWAEVLNLGGYDVLTKPFDSTEVFRVISLAWLNWKSKLERSLTGPPDFAQAVGM